MVGGKQIREEWNGVMRKRARAEETRKEGELTWLEWLKIFFKYV